MGKRLFRTDKNGTQYWVDDRCTDDGKLRQKEINNKRG